MNNKKVLILGPRFYDYCKSIGNAFEACGYSHQLIEWDEIVPKNFLERLRYQASSNKETFFDTYYESINVAARNAFESFKPDFILVVKGSIITEKTLHFFNTTPIVLWAMDSIFRIPTALKNIQLYKKVFLFEKGDIPSLKTNHNVDAVFLPLALDPKVYYPISVSEKSIDILFVGALYPNRKVLLDKLVRQHKDKNIQIYGRYFSPWKKPFHFFFRNNKSYFTNKTISPAALNKLYAKTKICINIHHSQSNYGVNQRFFEIIGAKALQVCDSRGFILDNFTNSDVLIYDNEQKFFEIIGAALENYASYQLGIEQAYKKVLEYHTFNNRVRLIIKEAAL